MTRRLVVSSAISAVGYDPVTCDLEVVMQPDKHLNRAVYRYKNVPADVHFDFVHAESLGRALRALAQVYGPGERIAIIEASGAEHPIGSAA